MNRKLLSKIIAMSIIAVPEAIYMHAFYVNDSNMGRDAFMAKEAIRWDKHMAHPHSVVFYIIELFCALGVFISVYELLAFVAFRFLTSAKKSTAKPLPTTSSSKP